MKIVLLQDVAQVGRKGEVKEVSPGFARNFLMPKKLAQVATEQTVAKLAKERTEHETKLRRENEKSKELALKLEQKTFRLKARTNKETLFAAIREKQIAALIGSQLNLEIKPEQVILAQPVKTIGLHEITVKFNEKINAKAKLYVEAETQ